MNECYDQMGTHDAPSEGIYGSVEGKIRAIAQDFDDCTYLFADYTQANIRLDKIDSPTILYLLPPSGSLNVDSMRQMVTDQPQTQIWFLCPADFDFGGEDNECRLETMKRLAIRFIAAINESELFEPIDGNVYYQVAYDAFDDNLTGICLNLNLKEIDGVWLCTNNYNR